MAWSEAAREAAAETRRRKSKKQTMKNWQAQLKQYGVGEKVIVPARTVNIRGLGVRTIKAIVEKPPTIIPAHDLVLKNGKTIRIAAFTVRGNLVSR